MVGSGGFHGRRARESILRESAARITRSQQAVVHQTGKERNYKRLRDPANSPNNSILPNNDEILPPELHPTPCYYTTIAYARLGKQLIETSTSSRRDVPEYTPSPSLIVDTLCKTIFRYIQIG